MRDRIRDTDEIIEKTKRILTTVEAVLNAVKTELKKEEGAERSEATSDEARERSERAVSVGLPKLQLKPQKWGLFRKLH